ncbi:hypothetical protein R1flu_003761 [Riccia fluitans]|uniref:Flavodoxin-like domain-containing protein n=1 Tax=Riccia fluitans TaxID=41844 RepID=A0ABD1Y9W1_9MARC
MPRTSKLMLEFSAKVESQGRRGRGDRRTAAVDVNRRSMDNKRRLLVLYATDTGNAQDVAERIVRKANVAIVQLFLHSTFSYELVF